MSMIGALVRVQGRVARWNELAAQRRQLHGLDGRILKDIGVSRAEAEWEARRPFWDDPCRPARPRR